MKAILRLRLKVPGHGAKLARLIGIPTVSQTGKITANNKEAPVIKFENGWTGFDNPKVLINYGVAHDTLFIQMMRAQGVKIINDPLKTEKAADKLKCLRILTDAGVPTLHWATTTENLRGWIEEGYRVYCRTLTRAKKGKGIVIATRPEEIVPAPLYTREYKKTHEHRVHVFKRNDGAYEIIDFVQKKRCPRLGGGEVNLDVRNKHNGWYFSHKNRKMSKHIRESCINAAKALDLDYCAIDVMSIWEDKTFISCVICEINTAPGLTAPESLEAYVNAFRNIA